MSSDKSKTVTVRIRISIKNIFSVDLVNQNFSAEFFLEASWIDFELKGPKKICPKRKSSQFKGVLYIENDENSYFAPRLSFRNLIENLGDKDDEWFQIYDDKPDNPNNPAIVCYRINMKGKFQQRMELHYFPADTQYLSIDVISGYDKAKDDNDCSKDDDPQAVADGKQCDYRVRLVQNLSDLYRSYVNSSNFVFDNIYELHPFLRFERIQTNRYESATNRTYPVLRVSSYITRKTGFWILNILLPLFFLTSMSAGLFAIHPDDIGGRCSILLVMLLTVVAYKYYFASWLPTVSYLTLLDMYILLCIAFQMVLMVITIVNGINANQMKDENPNYNDYDFGNNPKETIGILLLIWSCIHILLLIILYFVQMREKKKVEMKNNPHLWITNLDTTIVTAKGNFESLKMDFNSARMYNKSNKISKIISVHHWTYKQANQALIICGQKFISTNQINFSVISFQDEEAANIWMNEMLEYIRYLNCQCHNGSINNYLKSFINGIHIKDIKIQNLNPDWSFLAFYYISQKSRSKSNLKYIHPADITTADGLSIEGS